MSSFHTYPVSDLKYINSNSFLTISQCVLFCFNFVSNEYTSTEKKDETNFYELLYDSIFNGKCFMTYVIGIKINFEWEEIKINKYSETKFDNFELKEDTLKKFFSHFKKNESFYLNTLNKNSVQFNLLKKLLNKLNIQEEFIDNSNINTVIKVNANPNNDSLYEDLPYNFVSNQPKYDISLKNLLILVKKYYDENKNLNKENFIIKMDKKTLIEFIEIFYTKIAIELDKKYLPLLKELIIIFLERKEIPYSYNSNEKITKNIFIYREILNKKNEVWLPEISSYFLRKGWEGERIKVGIIWDIFSKIQNLVHFENDF